MLKYISDAEVDELVRRRWLGPIDSAQYKMSYQDFRSQIVKEKPAIRPAAEILAEIDKLMEGL